MSPTPAAAHRTQPRRLAPMLALSSAVAMRSLPSALPSGRPSALPSSTRCAQRSPRTAWDHPAAAHQPIVTPRRPPCRLPGAAPKRRRQAPAPARVASPEAPAAAPPAPAVNQHLAPSGQPACEAFGEPLCGRPDPLGATIDPDTVREGNHLGRGRTAYGGLFCLPSRGASCLVRQTCRPARMRH